MDSTNRISHLVGRIDELRASLRSGPEIGVLSERTGAARQAWHDREVLALAFFGAPVVVTLPEFEVRDPVTGVGAPVPVQAVMAYYFHASDGTPLSNRWVSFGDLPGGRFYNQAFQGYTGPEVVKRYGNNLEGLRHAAAGAGGSPLSYGDLGFAFQALPRVPLAIVYHLGDDEFPATCNVLFDGATGHYLPIDVSAILGSMLTRRLVEK